MAYNLRPRTFLQELLLENESNPEELLENDDEIQSSSDTETDAGSDYENNANVDSESDCEMEDASLNERLLRERRGRPQTKLKGKNGFTWSLQVPERRSGM